MEDVESRLSQSPSFSTLSHGGWGRLGRWARWPPRRSGGPEGRSPLQPVARTTRASSVRRHTHVAEPRRRRPEAATDRAHLPTRPTIWATPSRRPTSSRPSSRRVARLTAFFVTRTLKCCPLKVSGILPCESATQSHGRRCRRGYKYQWGGVRRVGTPW